MSRDMNRAEPPLIANGIVLAYGSGEDTDQAYPDIGLDDVSSRRIPGSTHATLYALDAETGKELWKTQLPTSGGATPMTYQTRKKSGKQFLVIAAGGHRGVTEEPQNDSIVAFALP